MPCTCKCLFQWRVLEIPSVTENTWQISRQRRPDRERFVSKKSILYLSFLCLIYTVLIVPYEERILDFEQLIHVSTGRHVLFLRNTSFPGPSAWVSHGWPWERGWCAMPTGITFGLVPRVSSTFKEELGCRHVLLILLRLIVCFLYVTLLAD